MFQKRKKTVVEVFTYKEIFLHNLIEKDFHRFLWPLNVMQSIMLHPKYQIRDNFVTPNRLPMYIVSFFATCVYVTMLAMRAANIYTTRLTFQRRSFEAIFLGSRVLNYVLNLLGHINDFVTNVTHGSNNVLLVIRLQEVYKRLAYTKDSFKKLVTYNWAYSLVVLTEFLGFYIIVNCWNRKINWLNFFTDCVTFSFHVNMLYSMRIMALMTSNFTVWMKQLKNTKKKNVKEGAPYWTKMFEVYVLMLESYKTYIRAFQELILQFVVDAFFHTLTYVQTIISFNQVKSANYTPRALSGTMWLIVIWVLIHFVIITFLGRTAEQYYRAIEKTQALSSKLLASPACEEAEKRMYKNVLRLYRSSFTKVKLNGFFYVDATLPIQLGRVTTSYVIVLLQFALL